MQKKLILTIPEPIVNHPLVYEMVTQYQIKPNIQYAALNEDNSGRLILEIEGTPIDIENAILYLRALGVQVE